MVGEAQVVVAPIPSTSRFDRFWLAAALVAAAMVNLPSVCFVGYTVRTI
jgi:hypothetical protein